MPVYGPTVERHRRVATSAGVALGFLSAVLSSLGPGLVTVWLVAGLGVAISVWLAHQDARVRTHAARTGEPWPDDWAVMRRHPVPFLALLVLVMGVGVGLQRLTDVPVGVAVGLVVMSSVGGVHLLHARYRRTGRTPAKPLAVVGPSGSHHPQGS
ncbi:hypothetical protein [Euzebya sp.]|uniref:hypothetical protein n=1 Tax=Euzebya sp. TaxID=1971409 RepID=UPI0035194F2A